MSDDRAYLESKLVAHYDRMERLRSAVQGKRAEADRVMADYDREWLVGENLRCRLRVLAHPDSPEGGADA